MKDCTIAVTAFDWVPSFAQGQVRDLRVRWALEEAGLPYRAEILAQGSQRDAVNLARQPFGQVPALELDGRPMFESGAIVWRIAEASPALLPPDQAARDRALCWLFAALNTVEPPIAFLAHLDFFTGDAEAAERLRPEVVVEIESRLGAVAAALNGDYLVGEFSAADLMMASVLRALTHTGILARFPALESYVARCTARPAFQKALADQMQPFVENAPRYEGAA